MTTTDPIVGRRLVDVDLTIRVIATEVEIYAEEDLNLYRDFVRDYFDRQASRTAASFHLPDATVAVTAVVREV